MLILIETIELSIISILAAAVSSPPNMDCRLQAPFESYTAVSWTGKCKDGFAHGEGKAVWSSEDDLVIYEGDVLFGAPQGKGKITYWDEETYEGEFSNGESHGYGISRESDGIIYEGFWRHGHLDGSVVATTTSGRRFNCLYNAGAQSQCWLKVKEEECIILFPFSPEDGNFEVRWTGQCIKGKANGVGEAHIRYEGNNGTSITFTGRVVDGVFSGKGALREVRSSGDGDRYEDNFTGIWSNSKRNGLGVETSRHEDRDGFAYFEIRHSGKWRSDRRDGFGERAVVKADKHGFRETEFSEGVWETDELNGPGKVTIEKNFADGTSWRESRIGEWAGNQLNRYGVSTIETFGSGKRRFVRTEGEFSFGIAQGKIAITDEEGNKFSGVVDRGVLDAGECEIPSIGFKGRCKRKVLFDIDDDGGSACLVPAEGDEECLPAFEEEWAY